MTQRTRTQSAVTLFGWTVALLNVFPISWMVLTSFKTEIAAVASPPVLLFRPTLTNYRAVFERANYAKFAANSLEISVAATIVGLVVAIPASYTTALYPTRGRRLTLLWILSTRMLPPVGVLVPVYLICRDLHSLDSRLALTVVLLLSNLPIMIWVLFSFFREVPRSLIEAARMDGARPLQELSLVLLPLARSGVAAAAILSFVLCWNEAFWSLNLTTTDATPLAAFIAGFSAPEGLFWAKLSSASTLAVAPILLLAWFGQRQLVRGGARRGRGRVW
jgi:sorbitol/mannitol transport system permease protein